MALMASLEGAQLLLRSLTGGEQAFLLTARGERVAFNNHSAWQLRSDGGVEIIGPANGSDFQLDEIYPLIGDTTRRDGFMETCPGMLRQTLLIVHEFSAIVDNPPMRLNVHASLLAGQLLYGDALFLPSRMLR